MNRHLIAAILAATVCVPPLTARAQTLSYMEWEGYISTFEADFEAHAKSKGKTIDLQILKKEDGKPFHIANADEIFQAVRAGRVDVVTPTHNYYQQERGKLLSLMLPMDLARVPNAAALPPALRAATFAKDDKGGVRGLPLLGGSYALVYNKARVKAPDSWTALLRPEARGRYAITSDQIEANIYQLALMAGVKPTDVYDFDKMTAEQRGAVQTSLNALVAGAASFWGGMATPEQLKDLDYATDYWFAVAAANKAGQDWAIATPKEGVTVWLDTIAITARVAEDPAKLEAAYMLVDYMLGVDAQAGIAREFGSVIVNPAAKAKLTPAQAAAQPGEDFFVADRFWQPLSPRTRNGFKKMWDDAMTAAGKKS